MAVIVVLLGISFFILRNRSPDPVTHAAKKGGAWLLAYQSALRDPGVPWVVHELNAAYCHEPRVDAWVDVRFREFDADPVEKHYRRLIDPSFRSFVDPSSLIGRESTYDDFLLPALYCREQSMSPGVVEKIFDPGATGYDLTHRLLALVFLRRNGCLVDRVDAVLDRVTSRVAAEIALPFTDLYVEQMAFVGLAGHGEKLSGEMFSNVVSNQRPDGGWKDPKFWGRRENPHTTMLALLALSQRTGDCPFTVN